MIFLRIKFKSPPYYSGMTLINRLLLRNNRVLAFGANVDRATVFGRDMIGSFAFGAKISTGRQSFDVFATVQVQLGLAVDSDDFER